jgi:hypothetical protein
MRASGSVVLTWVSSLRGLPFQSAWALRPPPPGRWSSDPSFGRKLFWLAHAWISVPSTEKCSFDSRPCRSARHSTSAKKPSTTWCSSDRSRFLEKVE